MQIRMPQSILPNIDSMMIVRVFQYVFSFVSPGLSDTVTQFSNVISRVSLDSQGVPVSGRVSPVHQGGLNHKHTHRLWHNCAITTNSQSFYDEYNFHPSGSPIIDSYSFNICISITGQIQTRFAAKISQKNSKNQAKRVENKIIEL